MQTRSRETTRSTFFSYHTIGLLLLISLGFGCADWHEFGDGPTNPHRTNAPGPIGGIVSGFELLALPAGSFHGYEVGVLTDSSGAYYVTSYSPDIHVYDPWGAHQNVFILPSAGSRGGPYVLNDFDAEKSVIFTGSAGGGFYAIEVDKDRMPYSMTLMGFDIAVGPSESPPKRAADGTLYQADIHGNITSFHYDFAAGILTRLTTYSLGEAVTGAIALYDLDPAAPGEEVLVATREGGFYVLDHGLTVELWRETTGHANADEYYAGVTVAERGPAAPIALLPIAGRTATPPSPDSGLLRAINLNTGDVDWELHPSATTLGNHEIPGSVSLMHPFASSGGTTTTDAGLDPTLHLATFASTDGHLYAVDLTSGLEVWTYPMSAAGFDAPVTDRHNVVYVGDGASILHAVHGPTGGPFWTNSMLSAGSSVDVVKLGLSFYKELLAASRTSAYVLLP